MKILVMGNTLSRWEKEFVELVLLPLGHEVTVYGGILDKHPYRSFYQEAGVSYLLPEAVSPALMRLPKIRSIPLLQHKIAALRSNAPYDCIINMFVNSLDLYCDHVIAGPQTKIIAYFCGSDILRCEGAALNRLKHALQWVDTVRFDSEKVKNGYETKIKSAMDTDEDVIHLGASVLDSIDALGLTKAEAKAAMQLPTDRICLCIGYNAGIFQQHLKVLEQIAVLPKSLQNRLFLLFPMTYGKSAEYIVQVRHAAEKSGIPFQILEEFMDNSQMALMHRATDILIHAQTTDGLSSSVLESMYAGSYLINGSWLDYPECRRWQLEYALFDSFSALPNVIQQVCEQLPKFDAAHNQAILYQKNSWNATKTAWEGLLNSL